MTVKMEQQFLCLPSYLHFHAEWHKYTQKNEKSRWWRKTFLHNSAFEF